MYRLSFLICLLALASCGSPSASPPHDRSGGSGSPAAGPSEPAPHADTALRRAGADDPRTRAAVDSLRAELADLAGASPYIVIDRTRNRLRVHEVGERLLDAVCATGSGKILLGNRDDRAWHFKTPKRVFTVRKKVEDPVWKKPLWAFVEKNEAAPVLPWSFKRLDGTTLGDYALELEDSYAIHGTLYPGLLGRSITHGCVRLDDGDLAALFRIARVGTPVYVF